MSIEQLVWDLINDAAQDVERALCWLDKAEDEQWINCINRVGWQSGCPWINDFDDAEVAREQACVAKAEQHLERLIAVLVLGHPGGVTVRPPLGHPKGM